MPDYGTTSGIGRGIGEALGSFGEAIQKRRDRQSAERDKQAESYEKQAQDIAKNIALAGGRDAPEAQPMVQELYGIVQKHNALYSMYETPALIDRIRGVFGGKVAQKPDLRASMTVGSMLAATPATPWAQQSLSQQYNQITGIMKRLYPNDSDEQIKERVIPILFPEKTTGEHVQVVPGSIPRKDPVSGKTYIQEINTRTGKLEEVEAPEHFASRQDVDPDEVAGVARQVVATGKLPAAGSKFYGPVMRYITENHLTIPRFGNSEADKIARALLDAKEVTSADEAKEQAAQMVLKSRRAKDALESGQANLNWDDVVSLAKFNIVNNKPDPNFGLSKNNPDRILYYRAKASLLQGGNAAELVAQGATIQSDKAALTDMTKRLSNTDALQRNLDFSLDQASKLSLQVDRTGASVINKYQLLVQGQLTDFPELQQLRIAVQTAAREYARVTSGGGQTSDADREHAEEVINAGLANNTLQAAVQQLKRESVNRVQMMQDVSKGLTQSIQEAVSGGPTAAPSPAGKIRVQYRAPDGTTHTGTVDSDKFDPKTMTRIGVQ